MRLFPMNRSPIAIPSMRILHLFDLYLPTTMNWAWQMMRATPDVETWVAAPWMVKNEYSSPEFRFFTRPLQSITGWMPDDEWKAAWFSTNLIRSERHWPRYRNWLYKTLKTNPPDVIHAHFGPVGVHYLDLAKRLKTPLITSFYGFDFARLPYEKPVYRERYRQLFQGGAAFTTTGELTPRLLEAQGCPAEKITPMPLSIFPEVFPFKHRIKVPNQLRLLQVATITSKKGHLDTLSALRKALQHCPNLHLTLAGERQDKNLFKEIRHFIATHHLVKNVTLLDFLPHADLPMFFGQFDVFIHPSRTANNQDCEGAPVVILEAQCSGLPVISTIHSDIPALILDGLTGWLAPENSPELLATYIERFYRMDNSEYQGFSQAAHQHMRQHFNLKNTGLKLQALYQSIRN